jgi:hypothetical protein
MMKRILGILLTVALAFGLAPGVTQLRAAQPVQYAAQLTRALDYVYTQVTNPVVHSVGGEWAVITLAKGDRLPSNDSRVSKYLANLKKYVSKSAYSKKASKVVLHSSKSTDNARVVLALTALGRDALTWEGYNLVAALADSNYIAKQGVNGPMWALIALDSDDYLVDNAQIRAWCLNYLLSREIQTSGIYPTGGWGLMANEPPDPDLTGMALVALSKYLNMSAADYQRYQAAGAPSQANLEAALSRAMTVLGILQGSNGGFPGWSGADAVESVAQVVTALSALRRPEYQSMLEAGVGNLLNFQRSSGGFAHEMILPVDQMASEQASYALVAYDRYQKGKSTLYDMRDTVKTGSIIRPKTVAPQVSGGVKVDAKSSAKLGKWSTSSVKVSYAWLVNGVKKSTKSSYTFSAAQLGASVKLQVTATKKGFRSYSWESAGLTVVLGDAPKAKNSVAYSGTVKAGAKLKAKTVKWNQSKVKSVFSWALDGVTVATGTSFTVPKEAIGKQLTLAAVGQRPGHHDSVAKLSKAKKVPKAAVTIKLSAPTQKVGVPGVATVTIKAPAGIVPTGDIRILQGKTVLVSYTLAEADAGKAVIDLPAFTKASTVKLVAAYDGSAITNAKKTGSVKIKVKK